MADFKEFFSKHAEGYSKSSSHASGRDLMILKEMLSHRRYHCALDIATGTGFTAIGIAEFCDQVAGLDPTPAMLEEARKNASSDRNADKITFKEGQAEATGFDGLTCDLVTCRRASHHFQDKLAFLIEAKRVLTDDGVLAIVDFVTPEEDENRYLDNLERIRDSSHVHAASESEWYDLLGQAGFELTEVQSDVEERTFGDWLYPVETNSSEGKKCLEYFERNYEPLATAGVYDPEREMLIKKRIILLARKEKGK